MGFRESHYYRTFDVSNWLWRAFWPMEKAVGSVLALYPQLIRTRCAGPGENIPARAA